LEKSCWLARGPVSSWTTPSQPPGGSWSTYRHEKSGGLRPFGLRHNCLWSLLRAPPSLAASGLQLARFRLHLEAALRAPRPGPLLRRWALPPPRGGGSMVSFLHPRGGGDPAQQPAGSQPFIHPRDFPPSHCPPQNKEILQGLDGRGGVVYSEGYKGTRGSIEVSQQSISSQHFFLAAGGSNPCPLGGRQGSPCLRYDEDTGGEWDPRRGGRVPLLGTGRTGKVVARPEGNEWGGHNPPRKSSPFLLFSSELSIGIDARKNDAKPCAQETGRFK